MLGPPGQVYEPVPTEEVWVFSGMDRVRVKHQPIAEISMQFDAWTEDGSAYEELVHELTYQAGKLGAHAVVLEGIQDESELGGLMVPIPSGAATAIRFVEPGLVEGLRPARSPREMGALVVAPVAVPLDVQMPDSIAEAFAQDIHAALAGAGLSPLPPGLYESVWEDVAEESQRLSEAIAALKGGDETRSDEQRILKILGEKHDADGFLLPDIEGVEAYFDGDRAEWDGVDQKVGETRSTGAKIVSGILNLFRRGEHDFSEEDTTPYGSVWALSLVVRIENAIGAQVYVGRGGLELLEKADFEGGIWFGDPMPEEYEIQEVPDEDLFQKPNRISRSVRIALAPLRTGG